MSLTPGTRLGPYEVLSAIGSGGMGEVYRATDARLNRDVAIKALPDALAADPDRVARFKREAQVLASLNHPNVAAIYGFEDLPAEAGSHVRALVMELVEGPTLEDRLAQGRIPVDEVISIAKQIADAIEYAHEKGVIHRDLKPANIKLTPAGTVKVLDFGLAKAFGPADAGSHASAANSPTLSLAATQMGLILGTAAYMSPEQAKGKPADRRADIWSFGIVLFELLAGRAVYSGETVSETIAAVIMKDPDWASLPGTTPPRLRELLRRCLVKDPRSRLQAIGEARIALEETLNEPAASVTAVPAAAKSRSIAWPLSVAAASLLGALVAGYAAWTMKPERARAVMRFSVPLPEDVVFTNTGRQVLALSPDGRNLVFVANQRLYLRALSDLESRVIPGSHIGSAVVNPAFSPDGQAVVFHSSADGTIKRLAIGGGALQTVCPAEAIFGMRWSEDGIVFGQRGKGIVRVAPDSRTPEVIVPVADDQVAASPQILPGGRAVLFSIKKAADTWDNGQVVVQPLNGGARKTLVDSGADGRYLPTGHLVYAHSGILLAVPFDLAGLAVTGAPVPVVEGVRRTGNTGATSTATAQFDFSSTGSMVYWAGPVVETDGFDLALFDRQGTAQPLKLPPRAYRSPRASPDGRFVTVESEDDREAVVWVYELSGGRAIRQLTFAGNNRAPIWSHDGQWILFQSDREGDLAIFRQRADGSGAAERLTKPEAGAAHWAQSASPDGAHLLFSVTKAPALPSLWTMAMKDRRTKALAGVLAREAVFSPDGRWIAYQPVASSGRRSSVFVEPFPPTRAKYLVPQTGGHPFWSPTGDELFMNIAQQASAVITVTTTPTVAFGQPLEFARRGRSEPDPAVGRRNVDMLPDGQRVVGVMSPDAVTGQAQVQAQTITVVLNWFDEVRRKVPTR